MKLFGDQEGGSALMILVVITAVGAIGFAGWWLAADNKVKEQDAHLEQQVEMGEAVNEKQAEAEEDFQNTVDETFTMEGLLEDVTTGPVRGVNTKGKTTGRAMTGILESDHIVVATLEKLPAPNNDDFYEGWLVNPSTGNFFSTGLATRSNNFDGYVNRFTRSQAFGKNTRYVLTLEPNDGDPAPADHIVEGNIDIPIKN